jgi:undecaprenyl diphosphate synthase
MSIDPSLPVPKHVAIIPDGNRRWARAQGLKPWEGHEAGAKNTEALVRQARSLGIRCISFWGSSQDNLKKRPLEETRALLRIYEEYFTQLAESPDIHEDRARIRFIGRWEEQFPSSLKKILYRCQEATREYDQYALNFFLAYNGDEEMLGAIRALVSEGMSPEAITPAVLKEHLLTHDLPAVDFLIRTGGEPHLSAGFMMWDIADAQLYFSELNYPDFGPVELQNAIIDYQQRGRRYGQ